MTMVVWGTSHVGVRAELGTQLVGRTRQLAPSVYLKVSRKARGF